MKPVLVQYSWNVMAHGDAREGKWRGNWRMEWVASTLTLPRNTVYPALLPLIRTPRLPVVDWTDATADLNGLVRFAERPNLVSARVPSCFKRSIIQCLRTGWASKGKKIFPSKAYQICCSVGTAALSPGLMGQRSGTKNCLHCRFFKKKDGAVPSLPYTSLWRAEGQFHFYRKKCNSERRFVLKARLTHTADGKTGGQHTQVERPNNRNLATKYTTSCQLCHHIIWAAVHLIKIPLLCRQCSLLKYRVCSECCIT
jgi:hypothetical protein